MRKKLFFLIVVGLVMSFTAWAQGTTTQINVSVTLADKVYDGKLTVDESLITAVDFTETIGGGAVSPTYTVVSISDLTNPNFDALQRSVDVTITLDAGQGFVFKPGSDATVYTTTVPATISVQPRPITVNTVTVADKQYDGTTDLLSTPTVTFSNVPAGAEAVLYDVTDAEYDDVDAGSRTVTGEVTLKSGVVNYVLTGSPYVINESATITPKALTVTTVTMETAAKPYDTTPINPVSVTLSGFVTGNASRTMDLPSSDVTVNATFPSDAGVWGGSNAVAATVDWTGSVNYTLTTPNNKYTVANYTINPIAVTVTANTQASKVYDGTLASVLFSSALTDYTVTPSAPISGGMQVKAGTDSKNVGTYTLENKDIASTDPNYQIEKFVGTTVTITKATATFQADNVSVVYPDPVVYADLTFTSTGLATGDVATVPLKVDAAADGSIQAAGFTKDILVNGAITIADGNNGNNYVTPYAFTKGTFTVLNASIPLTITPRANQSKIYGEFDPEILYDVEGLVNGDKASDVLTGALTYTGSINANSPVNLYDIERGTLASSNANYTIDPLATPAVQFEVKKAYVKLTPVAQSGVYTTNDVLPVNFTYALGFFTVDPMDPFTNTGDDPATVFAGNLNRKGVGAAAAAQADPIGTYDYTDWTSIVSTDSNYEGVWDTNAFATAKFSITRAEAIIIPKAGYSKSYGDTDPVLFDYDTDPAAAKATITGTLGRVAGEAVNDYAYTITGMSSTDYTLKLTTTAPVAKFSILKGLIEVDAVATPQQGKVYGATDPAIAYTVKPEGIPANYITGAFSRVTGEDVNIYNITNGTIALSTEAAANYTLLVKTNSATFEITPKPITVIPDAGLSKVYGEDDPELTYTLDGLVGDDDPATVVSGTLNRMAGVNVGEYLIVQGTVDLIAGGNYKKATPFFTSGVNFEITPAELTIAVNGTLTKIYGGAATTLGVTAVSAYKYADTDALILKGTPVRLGVNGAVAAINDAVGSYGYDISDVIAKSSKNYTYTLATDQTAYTITKKAITITPVEKSVNYGTDPASLGIDFTVVDVPAGAGLISGDTKAGSFTGALTRKGVGAAAATATDPTAKYEIIKGSLASANYDFTVATGKFVTIVPATITEDDLTITGNDIIYDGNGHTLTITADGIPTSAITVKYLDENGKEIIPTNAGSYTIVVSIAAGTNNNAAEITLENTTCNLLQRKLSVTAEDKAKAFGATDPTFTYTYEDLDTPPATIGVPFTGKLARVAGETAGTYDITRGTLDAGSNYNIVEFNKGTFTIDEGFVVPDPIELTVTAKAASKVYGAADPATWAYDVTGLTGGDTAASVFSGTLVRQGGENVGEYNITQGSLVLTNNKYTLKSFTGAVFTITKAAVTVTADAKTKVYGTTDPALTYTTSPAGVAISGNLTRAAGENAGTYAISGDGLKVSDNYTLTYVGANFTITKADQIITFNALAPVTTSTPAFALNASVNTGLELTYVSSDATVATVANGIVTPKAKGTTTITVTQAGNENYNAASKSQVLVVEQGLAINNVVAEGQIAIYPSVVSRNSTVTLDANVNVKDAELVVYNLNGKVISVTPVTSRVSTISTPSEAGAYIYVFKAEGINKTMRVLVK